MSAATTTDTAGDKGCLMVASIFTPIQGGSATVYANLCRFAPPGKMVALATRRHYQDGIEIPGWKEHDARCGFPIHRLDLLRPEMAPPPANKLVSVSIFAIFKENSKVKPFAFSSPTIVEVTEIISKLYFLNVSIELFI